MIIVIIAMWALLLLWSILRIRLHAILHYPLCEYGEPLLKEFPSQLDLLVLRCDPLLFPSIGERIQLTRIWLRERRPTLALRNSRIALRQALAVGQPRLLALAHRTFASAQCDSGEYDSAIKHFFEARDLFAQCGDEKNAMIAVLGLAHAFSYLSDRITAEKYYRETLDFSRKHGHSNLEICALSGLTSIINHDSYDAKMQSYRDILNITHRLGDRRSEAGTLVNMAFTCSQMSNNDEALKYAQQALGAFREIKDRYGEMRALSFVGMVYANNDDFPSAIRYEQETLKYYRKSGNIRSEGLALGKIGMYYRTLHKWSCAWEYNEKALKIFYKLGAQDHVAGALMEMGKNYQGRGMARISLRYYNEAIELTKKNRYLQGQARALIAQGTAYCELGELEAAENSFRFALAIGREISDSRFENEALDKLAQLGKDQRTEAEAMAKTRPIFGDDERIYEPGAMHTREEATAYDNIMKTYDFWMNRPQVQTVRGLLAKGNFGSLLDIGCGTGQIAISVAKCQLGLQVFGMDLSPTMLAVATENAKRNGMSKRVRFLRGNATNIPMRDDSLDMVINSHMLHHLSDPIPLLREMRRIVKPGGTLLMRDLLRLPRGLVEFCVAVLGLPYDRLMKAEYRDSFYASYSWREYKEMFERAGWLGAKISFRFPHFVAVIEQNVNKTTTVLTAAKGLTG